MIGIQNGHSGNPFEDSLEQEAPPRFIPSKDANPAFIKIPIVIACTIVVFVLLIAGTATTVISYPPEPPEWRMEEDSEDGPVQKKLSVHTALDGDYKLLGPLLIMAGGFLLIVDIVLCVIVTKEAYIAQRSIRPNSNIPNSSEPMSLLGGPFFLAVPSLTDRSAVTPFAFSRQLWTLPNAPLPDFASDDVPLKGSRIRPGTAVITRNHQPPFNPDVEMLSPTEDSSKD
ncbi:uncharacterized protein LOC129961820 [Argiope bruennichi]|uniref:Transmembrane protein n=1 Tax=Argiope bruennichi TaxID=94029 RepID=A0A8T0FTQ0_ARGBR|nr:uncharacterized protein LOC129961820 [Argiope bruennichi]XP_055931375.1 uncharacterized protein LOC129961820 [Argiope bruennichi]XP_055931376.1 uncharacterized protein LOC129961820 [Argiope bruennichi]KAF8793665.1 hypothetical protein HNY73_001715 [Argiope bruennichi]